MRVGVSFYFAIKNILIEQEVLPFSFPELPVLSKSLTIHLDIKAHNFLGLYSVKNRK